MKCNFVTNDNIFFNAIGCQKARRATSENMCINFDPWIDRAEIIIPSTTNKIIPFNSPKNRLQTIRNNNPLILINLPSQ